MNVYVKYFDKDNKYINFLVNDKEILKKYSYIDMRYGIKLRV